LSLLLILDHRHLTFYLAHLHEEKYVPFPPPLYIYIYIYRIIYGRTQTQTPILSEQLQFIVVVELVAFAVKEKIITMARKSLGLFLLLLIIVLASRNSLSLSLLTQEHMLHIYIFFFFLGPFGFLNLLIFVCVYTEEMVMPSEARVCESQSHKFKGPCVGDHNCALVCRNEGFSGGDCKGLRRRCFCTRLC
jgi:hypothetical protein